MAQRAAGFTWEAKGQQVLHQHDTGGCLQRNKCPSHPEPGWFKPRDLHLGTLGNRCLSRAALSKGHFSVCTE